MESIHAIRVEFAETSSMPELFGARLTVGLDAMFIFGL